MKPFNAPIHISSVASNGRGRGEFTSPLGDQREAEVPFTLPGEIVEGTLGSKRSGRYPARLLSIIQPSPSRVEPKCSHFGACGGCALQHAPYPEQIVWKEESVKAHFRPLVDENTAIYPMLSSPLLWEYRNKMEFSFSEDKKGNRYLGLMLEGGRGKVFNVERCFLASAWFSASLAAVRKFWEESSLKAYHPFANRGALRTLTLRETATRKEKMAVLTVSGNPEDALKKSDLQNFRHLFDPEVSLYLRIQQVLKGHPTQFFEMHLQGPEGVVEELTLALPGRPPASLQFSISPAAFFQPNTLQAMKLYERALELAEVQENDLFFDLYCGTGTIGMLASRFVEKVVGIEISYEAALDARENIQRNRIENMEVYTGDVGECLRQKTFPSPSVVCVDPPRAGLGEKTLQPLIALNAPRLLYISCNPATQASDIMRLKEAGYRIAAIQPVDQFPHTPHIENIAVLKKER